MAERDPEARHEDLGEEHAHHPDAPERGFEVGMDEAYKRFVLGEGSAWFANMKRTYDEMQAVSLESIRQQQVQFANTQALTNQLLQNAITNANLVATNAAVACNLANTQAVAHRDIATHHEWHDPFLHQEMGPAGEGSK